MTLCAKFQAIKYVICVMALVCLLVGAWGASASAQTVPNAAKADRIKPEQFKRTPAVNKPDKQTPEAKSYKINAPESAKAIKLVLKGVNIEGSSVYTVEELSKTYAEYIGKNTNLGVAWTIAGSITEKYVNDGYFLTRAYIPEQEVKNGVVTIRVVEGYIGEIELENPSENNRVIRELISSFSTQRPVKIDQVESFLLQLNDLPGQKFKGVFSNLASNDEAATKLTLRSLDKSPSEGSVTADNYGSRYLGPTQLSAAYGASFAPLNQTNVAFSSTPSFDELFYGSLEHVITLTPGIRLGVNFDRTSAYPGYSLAQYDVKSRSNSAGINLYYQALRQRQENVSLTFGLDGKNTNTSLLGSQISHDQIRALRAGASYDFFDQWNGYSAINVLVSQGIDGLDSSKAGDLNSTRAGARPDFRKAELSLQRQQALYQNLLLFASTSMQRASGTLYSSEQFGYGGQSFGRAYDASDIIGDHGVSGSLELRYKLSDFSDVMDVIPYGFYDAGEVWSDNPGAAEPKSLSGSSAGLGARFETGIGLSGNLGLAFPLTREVSTPIYGHDKAAPRVLLQISKKI